MEAVIWDDDEVRRQCKALALAADDTHALVSLEIDGNVFPTTCNRKALPGYLLSRLPQKAERNDNDSSWLKSVESVGKCKSSTNPQEELYCVVDSDSPFKGFVVDKKMLEFIGNGGVKHKRAVQPNGKRVCSFQFYQYNFHAGRKLSTSDVRHVDTTGHLTQGNPDCVYSLSQIAKSRFMKNCLGKAKVLYSLEGAYASRADNASAIQRNPLLDAAALQNALGGDPGDLVELGRFVKCPVQIDRARQQPKATKVWRETPCACHLTQSPDCPNNKATQQIFVKQKKAHDRKNKERNERKNEKRNSSEQ
jgi:hypothetical protein